jgi:hypothetical protein
MKFFDTFSLLEGFFGRMSFAPTFDGGAKSRALRVCVSGCSVSVCDWVLNRKLAPLDWGMVQNSLAWGVGS